MEKLPEFIANHLFLCSLFVAILGMLLWNLFGSVMTGIQRIPAAEATRLMNREKALVLDVRSVDEYANGHILHAINIPDKEIAQEQKKLAKHKQSPIIIYCSNGAVSARSARTLKMQGHEKVYCLNGGLQAWQGANLPITKAA